MNKFILVALLLSACTFKKGSGVYKGQVIDTSWEGIIFESCEVDFQYGEGSSKIASGSTRDKKLCEEIAEFTGKNVEIKYSMISGIEPRLDTNTIIESVKGL